MKEITNEKMLELLSDSEFIDKLQNVKSIDEGVSLFEENGVSITAADIEDGYKKGMSYLEENGYVQNGELTEAALEMVAGGASIGYRVAQLGAGVAGAGLGLLLAGVACTPGAGMVIIGIAVAWKFCNK